MQNITYPHLTNVDNSWEVVNLNKWTATKNLYLPLRQRNLQALDDLIIKHISQFNFTPGQCFLPGKIQHAFRSPYNPGPRIRPIYYINYAKAILSTRFKFSYHNWYDCTPEGTKLTRICPSAGCYNPDHHIFGSKPRYGLVDLEQVVEMTPDLEEWTDLIGETIPRLIQEGHAAGDPTDKIIHDVTLVASGIWGDRPIPSQEQSHSIEEFVRATVNPSRPTHTHVTTEEILGWLK